MRISTQKVNSFSLLVATAIFATACGVEVGNPGKPKAKSGPGVKNTEVEQKQVNLVQAVESQYSEALIASLENYALFDLGTTLSLLEGKGAGSGQGFAKGQSENEKAASKKGRVCNDDQGAQGELTLSREQTGKVQQYMDRSEQAKLAIEDTYQRKFSAQLSVAGSTLKCRNDKMGPDLDWSQLNLVGIESTVDRTVIRSAKKDDEAAVETLIKSQSKQEASIKKLAFESTGLKLERTLQFSSELSTKKSSGSGEEIKTSVKTLADRPLVIQEEYNAGSLLQRVLIARGAVSSVLADGSTVQLDYKDLVLDGSGSCQPLSGSIAGQVSSGSAQEIFSIVFEQGLAYFKSVDGEKVPLVLERCKIDSVSFVGEGDSKAKKAGK